MGRRIPKLSVYPPLIGQSKCSRVVLGLGSGFVSGAGSILLPTTPDRGGAEDIAFVVRKGGGIRYSVHRTVTLAPLGSGPFQKSRRAPRGPHFRTTEDPTEHHHLLVPDVPPRTTLLPPKRTGTEKPGETLTYCDDRGYGTPLGSDPEIKVGLDPCRVPLR